MSDYLDSQRRVTPVTHASAGASCSWLSSGPAFSSPCLSMRQSRACPVPRPSHGHWQAITCRCFFSSNAPTRSVQCPLAPAITVNPCRPTSQPLLRGAASLAAPPTSPAISRCCRWPPLPQHRGFLSCFRRLGQVTNIRTSSPSNRSRLWWVGTSNPTTFFCRLYATPHTHRAPTALGRFSGAPAAGRYRPDLRAGSSAR